MAERRRRGLPHISRTAASRNRNRGHQHERAEAKAKATAARAASRTPPPPPAPRRFQQPIRLVEGPGARTPPEAAQDAAPVAKQESDSRGSASMEDASSGTAPKQEMDAQSSARSEAASSSKAPRPEPASQSMASGEVASPGKKPKLEAKLTTGSGGAPSGARAVSGDQAEEDSDSEVSSAASLEMEPLREQTLADLMEHWVQAKRVKTEEPGPEPHMACLKQANQRHPKSARHWLSAEAFLFADVISGSVFDPPRRIAMLGKGNWRVVYSYNDRFVLKLMDEAHGNEAKIARLLPSITAEVLWEGRACVSMHDGVESTLIPFHGLLQRRSELATERFKQMTKAQIREFLFYVGAVMTWVESKGFSICDIGPSNLAVNPSSSFPPRLFLCDLQDWYQGGAPRKKGFSGLLRLAYQVCPEAEPALNKIWSSLRQHYPKRFAAFSAEAPAYRQLLQLQGCAVRSGALATSFNSGC